MAKEVKCILGIWLENKKIVRGDTVFASEYRVIIRACLETGVPTGPLRRRRCVVPICRHLWDRKYLLVLHHCFLGSLIYIVYSCDFLPWKEGTWYLHDRKNTEPTNQWLDGQVLKSFSTMNKSHPDAHRRSIMTKDKYPNILPQDSSKVPSHCSTGDGSDHCMPLQPSCGQILLIPLEWPSMSAMQLNPSDLARSHDPRSNHGKMIHSQQQGTSVGRKTTRRCLTDEERQLIGIYHDLNKTARQKDIAGNH